jgi:exodeoxyribonuclease VII large subunit
MILNVSFAEKDEAKALGARWNPKDRVWYVPDGVETEPFSKWLLTSKTIVREVEPVESTVVETVQVINKEGMPLFELLGRVKMELHRSFPDPFWVQADIAKIGLWPNVAYVELCDSEQGDSAKVKAIIWRNHNDPMQKFEEITERPLEKNLSILAKMKVSFHAKHGLSLVIEDIDPAYSIGAMELEKIRIRKHLREIEVFDNNRALNQPWDFERIAVIAPKQAAGLEDFLSLTRLLDNYGLCSFDVFNAVFQSDDTAPQIIALLKQVQEKNYDAVVIVRGGGGSADFYPLNNIQLAEQVCVCSLPIFVGIGHDRDSTILDEVANVSFATPSAVANHLEKTIIDRASAAYNTWVRVQELSFRRMEGIQDNLIRVNSSIHFSAVSSIELIHRNIEKRFVSIKDDHQRLVSEVSKRQHKRQIVMMGGAFLVIIILLVLFMKG